MSRSHWLAAMVVVSGLLSSGPLLGAEPSDAGPYDAEPSDAEASDSTAAGDPRERAEALFRESKQHYRAGRFAHAIELLTQAYALVGEPVLQYNLARAYDGNGNLEQAVTAYERYLAEEPTVKDRGAIETRIATLKRQLQERKALERDAAKAREQAQQPTPKSAQSTSGDDQATSLAVTPWVLTGVGVLGVGAGAVLGVLAQGRASDAEADPVNQSALETLDEGHSLATAANVAFVVGGAMAAAGLTWGIVDVASSASEPSQAKRLQLRLGLASCRLEILLD